MASDLQVSIRARGGLRTWLPGVGDALLGVVCLLSTIAVWLASLRHTGSLAFPIDDGYIYSNYVLTAAQGHPFTYNAGELSGGVTSLGWYILYLLSYWLTSPFHMFLAGLAPAEARPDPVLSAQAGHLYAAAYLVGAASLTLTSLGVRRLAELVLPSAGAGGARKYRGLATWALGAVAGLDSGLLWGAASGLESTFAACIATWAVYLLLADLDKGRLRASLVMAALLPWARPDLLAVGAACLLWLYIRALTERSNSSGTGEARPLFLYAAALASGTGLMALVYYVGWERPLPSSFYAKVGGLRLGWRFFSAAQELVAAGRYLPFVVGLGSLLGALSPWLLREKTRRRSTALLLLLVVTFYTVAVMLTLSWFGQEDRYLLPLHPFVIILCGLLGWNLVLGLLRPLTPAVLTLGRVAVAGAVGLLVLLDYVWATQNYAVEVRNIRDAHVAPSLWLAKNTPGGSVVASEPIGAIKLFSQRRTVDLVGLTSPSTLGTYRNWPLAWERLKAEGVSYLLFYPNWFDNGTPPPWAREAARFEVPDNKIAGDSEIAIYSIEWEKYLAP